MIRLILMIAAASVIAGGFAYSYVADRNRRGIADDTRPRRISLLTEAMGYTGAVLVIAGVAAAINERWDTMSDWAHVGVYAGTTALFLAMGILVLPIRDTAIQRLVSVVWLASAAGFAAATGFAAYDVYGLSGPATATAIGLGTAAYAMILWLIRPAALQNLALLAALAVAVCGIVAVVAGDDAPPLPFAPALWALGVGWALAKGLDAQSSRRAGIPFGAILLLIAPSIAVPGHGWMYAIAIGSSAAVMAVSVPTRSTPLLVLGTGFAFGYVTGAVLRYYSDSLGVPATLAVTGLLIIALTIVCARLVRRIRPRSKVSAVPAAPEKPADTDLSLMR